MLECFTFSWLPLAKYEQTVWKVLGLGCLLKIDLRDKKHLSFPSLLLVLCIIGSSTLLLFLCLLSTENVNSGSSFPLFSYSNV